LFLSKRSFEVVSFFIAAYLSFADVDLKIVWS
jgi:hypothetical protein